LQHCLISSRECFMRANICNRSESLHDSLTKLSFDLISLYHPLGGITNLKYKLLCFLTYNKKNSKIKALDFKNRCCHLGLCLRLILFHWNILDIKYPSISTYWFYSHSPSLENGATTLKLMIELTFSFLNVKKSKRSSFKFFFSILHLDLETLKHMF
jgi:hypothetical protein